MKAFFEILGWYPSGGDYTIRKGENCYTVQQASEIIGVSENTIYRLRDAGELPLIPWGVGNTGFRIPESQIKAFMQRRALEMKRKDAE